MVVKKNGSLKKPVIVIAGMDGSGMGPMKGKMPIKGMPMKGKKGKC